MPVVGWCVHDDQLCCTWIPAKVYMDAGKVPTVLLSESAGLRSRSTGLTQKPILPQTVKINGGPPIQLVSSTGAGYLLLLIRIWHTRPRRLRNKNASSNFVPELGYYCSRSPRGSDDLFIGSLCESNRFRCPRVGLL